MPSEQEKREIVYEALQALIAEGRAEEKAVIRDGQPVELFQVDEDALKETIWMSNVPQDFSDSPYTLEDCMKALTAFAAAVTKRDERAAMDLLFEVLEETQAGRHEMAILLAEYFARIQAVQDRAELKNLAHEMSSLGVDSPGINEAYQRRYHLLTNCLLTPPPDWPE